MILDFDNSNLITIEEIKKKLIDIMAYYSYQEEENSLIAEIDEFRKYILEEKEENYQKLYKGLLKAKTESAEIHRKLKDGQMFLLKGFEESSEELTERLKKLNSKIALYEKEIKFYFEKKWECECK